MTAFREIEQYIFLSSNCRDSGNEETAGAMRSALTKAGQLRKVVISFRSLRFHKEATQHKQADTITSSSIWTVSLVPDSLHNLGGGGYILRHESRFYFRPFSILLRQLQRRCSTA